MNGASTALQCACMRLAISSAERGRVLATVCLHAAGASGRCLRWPLLGVTQPSGRFNGFREVERRGAHGLYLGECHIRTSEPVEGADRSRCPRSSSRMPSKWLTAGLQWAQ